MLTVGMGSLLETEIVLDHLVHDRAPVELLDLPANHVVLRLGPSVTAKRENLGDTALFIIQPQRLSLVRQAVEFLADPANQPQTVHLTIPTGSPLEELMERRQPFFCAVSNSS